MSEAPRLVDLVFRASNDALYRVRTFDRKEGSLLLYEYAWKRKRWMPQRRFNVEELANIKRDARMLTVTERAHFKGGMPWLV